MNTQRMVWSQIANPKVSKPYVHLLIRVLTATANAIHQEATTLEIQYVRKVSGYSLGLITHIDRMDFGTTHFLLRPENYFISDFISNYINDHMNKVERNGRNEI